MSLKCPACAFESPDGSKWCDFCKEPFRAKKRPPLPVAAGALPLDAKEIEKKLAADWEGKEPLSWSPRTRKLAIGFLMGLLFLLMALGILLMLNSRAYHGPGSDIPLGKIQIINIPKTGSPAREDSQGGNPP